MADLAKLVDDLSSLTVLEAAELAKLLEEKWGVSAAAAVAVAAPAGWRRCRRRSRSRPSSRSCSPPPATRRSRSSRRSARSPASASRKPRTSSRARRSPSRKASRRTRPRRSRRPAREGRRQGRAQVMLRAACGASDLTRSEAASAVPEALRPGPSVPSRVPGQGRDAGGPDDCRAGSDDRRTGRRAADGPWDRARERCLGQR